MAGEELPEVGTIARSRDIPEKHSKNGRQKFIWVQCPDCGVARWVQYNKLLTPPQLRCRPCAIEVNKREFKVGKRVYGKD